MTPYLITAAVLGSVGVLVLLSVLALRYFAGRGALTWEQNGDRDQWSAMTPVGGAVLTRVWDDDKGWDWEIEMDYKRRYGGRTTLLYGNVSLKRAQRRVADLVTERTGADVSPGPRQRDLWGRFVD